MSLSKRLAVGLFLAVFALPAAAGEHVYLFRTQEVSSIKANCAPGEDIILGALLYTPRTRASDGLVMKDAGEPVGTAIGCGTTRSYTPFDPNAQNPFSLRLEFGGGTLTANGTCTLTSLTFPIQGVPAPLLLAGCTLRVNPSPSLGVVNGIATSASVFTPWPLPGFGTGSFWTVQVYTND
ncbi:hypothetical protein [Anaeromyxobacter oryzisoli]|uniref:hypothetical protein n=1 Tax=Anaeromyxobacter oryzisoli TaxID=2925408 RepID=UPI001F5756A6|nr:hypothetical protein [Anaeromyxobacter sp. SG63]